MLKKKELILEFKRMKFKIFLLILKLKFSLNILLQFKTRYLIKFILKIKLIYILSIKRIPLLKKSLKNFYLKIKL